MKKEEVFEICFLAGKYDSFRGKDTFENISQEGFDPALSGDDLTIARICYYDGQREMVEVKRKATFLEYKCVALEIKVQLRTLWEKHKE
jgi:hypothetical protein